MSEGRERVSVVIPAYNSARFVAAAVAAAGAQTYPVCEVIVVDDGSTDDTAAVARAAGATVISQRNGGAGAARNAGIRAASGTWIALLDADDVWHRDKLERQWAAHERREDVGLIASDYVRISANGPAAASVLRTHAAYRNTARLALGDGVIFIDRHDAVRALTVGQFLLPSTVIVRKELAERVPFAGIDRLTMTATCYIPEDLEWYLRVLRLTDVLVLERPLVDYLTHCDALSSRSGRLRYGDAKLVDIVRQDPSAYADGALENLRAERPRKLREASLEFLREIDYAHARVVLRDAWRERHGPDDAALLVLASLLDSRPGRALGRTARATWRRALKPAIARIRRFRS